MIKINLMGEDSGGASAAQMTLVYFGAVTAVCLAAVAYTYISTSKSVSALQVEQRALQSDLSGLQERTKAVKELESKRTILKSKLSVIAKLKKSKIGPVKVMDDLNIAIPPQVWLREIKEAAGNVKIKGRALNNQQIAAMMQNLQKSNYFDQVDLVESRQMYYSRSTGKVTPLADITRLKTTDFSRDSRVTKQASSSFKERGTKSWSVKDSDKKAAASAKNRVDEANVTVNEFVLSAKVLYAGKKINVSTDESVVKN